MHTNRTLNSNNALGAGFSVATAESKRPSSPLGESGENRAVVFFPKSKFDLARMNPVSVSVCRAWLSL